jgi:hypothetical protein
VEKTYTNVQELNSSVGEGWWGARRGKSNRVMHHVHCTLLRAGACGGSFPLLLLGDDPDGVDDAGDVGEEGEQQADPELDLQVEPRPVSICMQSEITRVILTVVARSVRS